MGEKTNLSFEGTWKSHEHTVEVKLPMILFEEDGTHIMYCPALDVSGYGYNETEAKRSFELSFAEFLKFTTNKRTLHKVLTAMGWSIRSKSKPMIPPPISRLLEDNENFRNIFDNYPYRKVDESLCIPA
ncbi:hypothetical protein SDC9_37018 [bioreactor metagenome]|uniref:Uncharacterized protein n=1 Tax=bioreactor metagenome TaxID=1076179 RepID=A0A644VHU4_9ZZZZ|nr:hypothetical protein [Lentimicrobium sp.]MEA5110417.1 hypothetical protein [Lentimicrobium sp.]